MPNYTMHCVGFEPAQQVSIAAILDLADSALSHSWNIIEDTVSDVVMINMQEENAQQLLSQYNSLTDYRIILVADSSQDSFQTYWFLEKKQHAPPSLRALVDLLNQVGICLDEAEASKASEVQQESAEPQRQSELDKAQEIQVQEESEILEVPEISELKDDLKESEAALVADIRQQLNTPRRKLMTKNYFFGFLLQASKDKKYRIVKLEPLPDLYLSPGENSYCFSGTDGELLQYCLSEPQGLTVNMLSRAKFNKALKAEPDKLDLQGLKSLVTYAIIQASNGQLLDGHVANQQFILRSMPDVDGDSTVSCYKEIADYMYQQEVNLFDVAEKLQLPLSELFDFYNVCYLLGYVKVIGAGEKNEKSANSRTLGRFLKSFFTK